MTSPNHEFVKANLNLYAVLQNLEDLVEKDSDSAAFAKTWNQTIQFTVKGGPKAWVSFKNGRCRVGRGRADGATIRLFFLSAAHLNKMFDNKGAPIPLKGFTRLPFLATKFSKLTKRLEYFLKPTDTLLADPNYRALNTLFTLNTSVFAAAELSNHEDFSRASVAGLKKGEVLMKVLPEGPSARISFDNGAIAARKGDSKDATAFMYMRNVDVANAFLNQKTDAFSAIAKGDVAIWGQMPFLDALSRVLDRIPLYLT